MCIRDSTQRRAPSQYATLEMLAQVQEIPSGDLYAICPKAKSGLAPLVKRGAVVMEEKAVRRLPFGAGRVVRDSAPPLTEQQRAAAGRIAVAMEEESGRVFLLHGITAVSYTHLVVFTGSLSRYTRSEIQALAEGHGANVQSTVGKGTDLLVAGERAGSKLRKAQELGIEVLTEDEFLSMLGDETAL